MDQEDDDEESEEVNGVAMPVAFAEAAAATFALLGGIVLR